MSLIVLMSLMGCTALQPDPSEAPSAGPTAALQTAPSPGPTDPPTQPATQPATQPRPGRTPPTWLGARPLPTDSAGFGEVRRTPAELRRRAFTLPDSIPPLPGADTKRGYLSAVTSPAPKAVIARSTWRPECPVAADQLAWLRVSFVGFDRQRHWGELLVNAEVAADLDQVFAALYRARFPLERVAIATRDDLDAPPTGDGNVSGAFVCRPTRGASFWSQHAYGLAVDLNSFQNPYEKAATNTTPRRVLPELASSYLDRATVRPGMIAADGPVVRAFEAIGWRWGGDWRTLRDYQHFSRNGL